MLPPFPFPPYFLQILRTRCRFITLLTPQQEGDPEPKTTTSSTGTAAHKTDAGGLGIGVYALILVGGAVAFFAYQYLQSNQNKS